MEEHFGRDVTEEAADAAASSPLTEHGAAAVRRDVWPHATWLTSGPALPSAPQTLAGCGVQERLITRWREVQAEDAAAAAKLKRGTAAWDSSGGHAGADLGGGAGGDFVSAEQQELFNVCRSYKDLLFPCRPYPLSAEAPDALLDAVLLHCLAHVGAAAAAIKRNSERLKGGETGVTGAAEAPRDQGFTRPKVLLLLPLRSLALRATTRLAALAQRETRADSIQGKQRLVEEFGAPSDEESGAPGARGRGGSAPGKPAEHAALFAGNSDDHFRFGVKITRGAVRLFADFYQADVIMASPLGLSTALSAAAKEGGGATDFLSSIEIAAVDRADVMLMQNWAHVTAVFEALNRLPEAQHGADIMRVRPAALAGRARHVRQTILLASFASAELNALARGCANVAGRARLQPTYEGVLGSVLPRVRQLFERFRAPSAAGEADARFAHFCRIVWPRMREAGTSGQLLFVPSYFDYVRMRALAKAEGAEFAALSEYAKPQEAARARSRFADGRLRLAMTTERAHFFLRIRMRGVRELVVYQVPEHAHFYAELVNLLDSADASAVAPTVTVLFSRFDAARLERVVGRARAERMLSSAAATFVLC
ncbi:hypothetical protein WJX81_006561 [Elliptochloris bilobata]|uniref:U3 small nucleolar RNA-associated protein 25 n=1 Tax=Elliptochloris bilobata TaxID=381761 RepID=A0AAW1QHX3_9CHLO